MATLLDILGLDDPAAALMAAATGGSVAPADGAAAAATTPAAGAQDNGTGGAAAGAAAAPNDPMAALAVVMGLRRKGALKGLSPAHLKVLGKALEGQGQTRTAGATKGRLSAVLDHFGGQVIGSMTNEKGDHGHAGDGAVVLRDGKLWHVYDDGTKLKIQEGAVARALGIGGNVTGGAMAPAGHGHGGIVHGGGRGQIQGVGRTGGALAPTFGHQQPGPQPGVDMEGSYSRGPGLSEAHRVPLDPLTGGVLAPEADGTSQAAVATESDVPLTGAEAYRRRLMAAHARLGL